MMTRPLPLIVSFVFALASASLQSTEEQILVNIDSDIGAFVPRGLEIKQADNDPTDGESVVSGPILELRLLEAFHDWPPKAFVTLPSRLAIDPSKGCRIAMNVYLPGEQRLMFGGYAYEDPRSSPLEREEGGAWQYQLKVEPESYPEAQSGWKRVEVVIPPHGREDRRAVPADAAELSLTLRVWGDPGTVWVSGITVAEGSDLTEGGQ